MATRPTATIQRIRPPKGRLVFREDNIIDGRVPIEMMQSNAIKQALAALDHLPNGEEFTYIDSNLPIRLDPSDRHFECSIVGRTTTCIHIDGRRTFP